MKLQKNVPNTDLQDITWSLSCTDARVQDVVGIVKSLQLRMESFEEGISVVRNLTEEISKLKEFVLMLTKETTDLRRRCVQMEKKEQENEKRSRWSEIETPATKNNDTSSQNGIWRFPWNTGTKNNDDSYLLKE